MNGLCFDLQLANSSESLLERRGIILDENISPIYIKGFFNESCKILRINEDIAKRLKLVIIEKRTYRLEDNSLCEFNVVNIEVRFKSCFITCDAIVSSENEQKVVFEQRLLHELNLTNEKLSQLIKLPGIREIS